MTEKKAEVIGIDLGGTAIKLGRFLEDGTCLEFLTVPTPQPATPSDVLDTIVSAVNQISSEQVVAIGLGTPGPVDVSGKVVKVAINLAGWNDIPLGAWLEEKTGLPTILANDANCAGLGEAWIGAGKHYQNLILLTLGTGVGGAIILNERLFVGHNGAAGELGLITLNPDGPPCNSGNQGSLEQYLCIGAIRRQTGKEPHEMGALAQAADPEALQFWQDYGKTLGIGLTSLIYVFTPEVVVIGGGVAASAEFFLPAALAEIEQRVLPISREGLKLLVAELGNQAGMVGAAKLGWQMMAHRA